MPAAVMGEAGGVQGCLHRKDGGRSGELLPLDLQLLLERLLLHEGLLLHVQLLLLRELLLRGE